MPAINIPNTWDASFLAELAHLGDGWGVTPSDNPAEMKLSFFNPDVTVVENAIAAYPAAYLAHVKSEKLDHLAKKRYIEEQKGPSGLTLNDKTIARLTAAALSLLIDTNKASVNWKLDVGNFITLPRAHVLGLAVNSVNHVQNCFDHEEYVSEAIFAVTLDDGLEAALEALNAIDVNHGWPIA